MVEKRILNLSLNEAEMEALETLAARKGVSKTALIRQAVRLYALIEDRIKDGDKLFIEGGIEKEKMELMIL